MCAHESVFSPTKKIRTTQFVSNSAEYDFYCGFDHTKTIFQHLPRHQDN